MVDKKGCSLLYITLGSVDFPRLRIGIGEPICDIVDYVLSEFSENEEGITIEQTVVSS